MRLLRKALFKEKAGNTAMIFALLTPVLVLLGGGAVDVTNASMRQAKLQQAADAAAVSAVSQTSPGYQYALNNSGNGAVPDTITATNAKAVFNANWQASSDTAAPVISGNACSAGTYVCKQGQVVKSYVQATSVFTPSFLGLIGRRSIALSAVSQGTASTPTYINYYILVDISQSMGIASTPTDMANLYNRVYAARSGSDGEMGCVFGCHVPAPNTTTGGAQVITNEQLAHLSPKITLRIDSAVTAIQNIIAQAQTSAGSLKNIKIGLYTMSQDPTTGVLVNTVAAPSSDYASLNTLAGTIDLGGNNIYGFGDSDFSDQLTTFNNLVPSNGTGVSGSPLNYVFIVTDGLADTCQNNHCDSAFNASLCTPLQGKSTVGVIYTTYVPITNQNNAATYNASVTAPEGNYSRLVAPYLSQIPTNLQTCASSPGLYFEASQGSDIISAMAKLFAATQKTARIAS